MQTLVHRPDNQSNAFTVKSADDDKLELATKSASDLYLLGFWLLLVVFFVLGHHHGNSGFLVNIENAFCFVWC
jgi:hypothetical protein